MGNTITGDYDPVTPIYGEPYGKVYGKDQDSYSSDIPKGVVPLDSTELAEKIKKLALEIVELSKQIDDSNIDYPY